MKFAPKYRMLCCVAALFGLATSAMAATYYVAIDGSDANNGSATSKWRTVSHAVSSVVNGDIVSIGPGEFPELIAITNSITLRGSDTYNGYASPWARHDSYTFLRPPSAAYRNSPLVWVMSTNVVIERLSIVGDCDGNGTPDVKFGIYCTNKPLTVSHCYVGTIGGYGICALGDNPPPDPSDSDSMRSLFECNTIVGISHTNAGSATGILMDRFPVTCVSNTVADIAGSNALAGILVQSCYYTTNMSQWVTVKDNSIYDCSTAIWGSKFGTQWEKIEIRANYIEGGQLGIRLSGSKGQAILDHNVILVSGALPTPSALPARGIWIQADYDPWSTNMATDHLVLSNRVIGAASTADQTIGMLFDYGVAPSYTNNNGVRATVISNTVAAFDYGACVVSGTNGVGIAHDPLVEVIFHFNDFVFNKTYALLAVNAAYAVNAENNWWQYPGGPTNPAANYVSTDVDYTPWLTGPSLAGGDADGDYLPDVDDPDDDNDGFYDYEELVAGTIPTNPLSFFEIGNGYLPSGTNVVMQWTSATGRTYRVYYSTNLKHQEWFLLATRAATPPTNIFYDFTVINRANCFYRITASN